MQPTEPSEPQTPQPGTVINPSDPAPTPSPPALEPDPPEPDDPRPQVSEQAASNPYPEPTPAEAPPDQQTDTPLITWQASEYVHHDKKFTWYLIFFVVIAGLIAVAAITHQWLTIGVFTVMAIALMVYANKAPRVLNYSIGSAGITIETKFYPYTSFRSFGLIQDVAWHLIDLEPVRRFMPRLSIMFEDANRDQIVQIMSEHMPRQDRQPDFIERAARALRF